MQNELSPKLFQTLLLSWYAIAVIWTLLVGVAVATALPVREKWLRNGAKFTGTIGLVCGVALFFFAPRPFIIEEPDWFEVGEYRYVLSLVVDGINAWFFTLTNFLFIAIASFAGNYLHRDPGYRRFFLLTAFANLGVGLICFAKAGDLLFLGWELVGVSSFLLISFFQNHESAARQSINALVNYRIADAFIALALLLWHGVQGQADLFDFHRIPNSQQFAWWLTGLFLIIGSLGKSGQFPFAAWLPRAMEGPTPSSALFYGGISVHLGPFLLLRTYEVWSSDIYLRLVLAGVGGLTLVYSMLVGRTQANVKGQLGYAVMSQIGIMLIELSLGLKWLAVVHLTGHALLRTWQYLRASALIQDYSENRDLYNWFKSGRFLYPEGLLPPSIEKKIYPYAVQGFYLSTIQKLLFLRPILALARLLHPPRRLKSEKGNS